MPISFGSSKIGTRKSFVGLGIEKNSNIFSKFSSINRNSCCFRKSLFSSFLPPNKTDDISSNLLNIYYSNVEIDLSATPSNRFPSRKPQLTKQKIERFLLDQEEQHNLQEGDGDGSRFRPLVGFIETQPATFEELVLGHNPNYVHRVLTDQLTEKELRVIGLNYPQMKNRSLASVGATLSATREVLNKKRNYKLAGVMNHPPIISANLGGGSHHAFSDRGEGYCVFNDIAVASIFALQNFPDIARKILVIDLDVHQGNGTAAILKSSAGEHVRSQTFTLSMHAKHCFPFSTRFNGDLDVDLPDGTRDEEYLSTLESTLDSILDPGSRDFHPDLVFFQSGVDSMQNDRLGRLALTRQGLQRRNRIVMDRVCKRAGAALVITLGGGYGKVPQDTIDAHSDVYIDAIKYVHGKI